MGQPAAGDGEPMEKFHIDLGDLMLRVQKLIILTQPFLCLADFLQQLRRWEHSSTCVLVLVIANFSCFLLPSGYNFLLILLGIAFSGLLGFMHRRTQCLSKVFPNANVKYEDFLGKNGQMTHADIMRQYKTMLFTIDTVVEQCNYNLRVFYSILKWDNLEVSIRSYLAVTILVIFLHLLPFRWSVAMTINIFLLEQKVAAAVVEKSVWLRLRKEESIDQSDCISLNSQDSPSTDLDTMTFGPQDSTDSEESEKQDDTSGPDDESDREVNYDPEVKASTSKSGVVGKLLEFKKKHQSTIGQCIGCNVQFSTILKRKHICSHCGNHFCSRCCSHKVPRSMFGATSPAAQTETVPVCAFCYMYLTGRRQPLSPEKFADKDKESERVSFKLDDKDQEENKEKTS